ncbi:MAG: DUF4097 family beta strand repeat protein [candidate division Zixibacteria bacterium]|nr:DUF4097 family beta strand repeat protein [candidate division Zixibacteria bacterium]
MRRYFYRLPLLAVLLLLATGAAHGGEYGFEYQKIVKVGEPVQLELRLEKGSVTVVGSEDDRIIIEAVKTVRASNQEEAEEVADHIEIKVKSGDHKVEIETNFLRMISRNRSFWSKFLGTGDSESYGSVNYRISVPTQTSVSIVSLDAHIDLSSIEGDVRIENTSGSTRAEYLFGSIDLRQSVGDIELLWIEGDIRVKSKSSKIMVRQVRGAMDLSTFAGSVNIQTELESPKDFFVETTSGSITFSIPSYASGELNIETDTGEIKTEIPVAIKSLSRRRLVGEIGQGGPRVTLSSTTGDVDVNQF